MITLLHNIMRKFIINTLSKRGCAMVCAAVMGSWSAVSAAETDGQLMLLAAPGGTMYAAGAEFGGSGNSSFTVRAGGFSYSYKSGDYWEDGSGSVAGIGGRYYTQKSMEGLFFGVGLDLVSGSASWGGWGYSGSGTFGGIAPNAVIGYKIRSNGGMSFEPSINAELIGGHDIGVIAGIGLVIGKQF